MNFLFFVSLCAECPSTGRPKLARCALARHELPASNCVAFGHSMGVNPRIDTNIWAAGRVRCTPPSSVVVLLLCCAVSFSIHAIVRVARRSTGSTLRASSTTSQDKSREGPCGGLAWLPSRSGPSSPGDTGRGMWRSWRGRPLVLDRDAPKV